MATSIPGPALFVVNPHAREGRSILYARELLAAYRHQDTVCFEGEIEPFVSWHLSPEVRIARMAERFQKMDGGTTIIVGGDGTVREVLEAHHHAGGRTNVVFAHGGTANDLAKSHGVPRAPQKFWGFLRSAVPIPIRSAWLWPGFATKPILVVHSASFGISGAIFAAGEQLKSFLGAFGYVLSLLAHIPRITPFQAVVGTGPPQTVADVILAMTSRIGGVIAAPMPPEVGARLFLLPVRDRFRPLKPLDGSVVLAEGGVRRGLFNLGFRNAARPGANIFSLRPELQPMLVPERPLRVHFRDLAGVELHLPGVVDGDVIRPVSRFRVRPIANLGSALAAPRSEACWFNGAAHFGRARGGLALGKIALLVFGALFLFDSITSLSDPQ